MLAVLWTRVLGGGSSNYVRTRNGRW